MSVLRGHWRETGVSLSKEMVDGSEVFAELPDTADAAGARSNGHVHCVVNCRMALTGHGKLFHVFIQLQNFVC